MSKPYYILAYIDHENDMVAMEFGDYVKSVVVQEQKDFCYSSGIKKKDTVVYKLNGDTQADIDACIADANVTYREGMFHFAG